MEYHFKELPRETPRRSNGITYSVLKSGHANIYFLSGLADQLPKDTHYVNFLCDSAAKVIAVMFSDIDEPNAYKLMTKRNRPDAPRGQLFVSARFVTFLLKEFGYPEKTLIPVRVSERDNNLFILSKT